MERLQYIIYCAQLADVKSEKAKILDLSFIRRHLLIDTIVGRYWNHGTPI